MIKRFLLIFFPILYILIILYFAVLSRESSAKSILKLDLFWSYSQPGSAEFNNSILNIVTFIPIGFLVGVISKNFRVGKAFLVGLVVSLIIELSQLFWKKGVFDVDDLFNNTVGVLLGVMIVIIVDWIRKGRGGERAV